MSTEKLKNLYPNINITITRAIVKDVIEINLGLDYRSTEELSDDEIYSLYTLTGVMLKVIRSNSAKATLLNLIRCMGEPQCVHLLNIIKKYE